MGATFQRTIVRLAWIAKAFNKKTGPIITAYAGASIDEAKDTCKGCPLFPVKRKKGVKRKRGQSVCYAWSGSPRLGFGAMALKATGGVSSYSMVNTDAVKPGGHYSLENAIANRHRDCKAARLVALGDGARVDRSTLFGAIRRLRRIGMSILAYTHHWREQRNQSLRHDFMASCDTLAEADEALESGWVPAAIVHDRPDLPATITTPGGAELVMCPAQRSKTTSCNTCRLCDPKAPFWRKLHRFVGIGFFDHSKGETE